MAMHPLARFLNRTRVVKVIEIRQPDGFLSIPPLHRKTSAYTPTYGSGHEFRDARKMKLLPLNRSVSSRIARQQAVLVSQVNAQETRPVMQLAAPAIPYGFPGGCDDEQ